MRVPNAKAHTPCGRSSLLNNENIDKICQQLLDKDCSFPINIVSEVIGLIGVN